jgi:hypothetical protein
MLSEHRVLVAPRVGAVVVLVPDFGVNVSGGGLRGLGYRMYGTGLEFRVQGEGEGVVFRFES